MNIKTKSSDILWSYIGTALSMTANIIMIPVIVYYLDKENLGLWYVFCSIGSMTSLFDFGFSTTFARNITYCWCGAKKLNKENACLGHNLKIDWQLMKNVLAACKKVYFRISSLVVILLIFVGTPYIYTLTKYNFTGYLHYVAWCLYALAIFLNLYYGYYVAFLRGIGAIAIVNKNTVWARIAQIVITVGLLITGLGIIGASIGYLSYGLLFRYLSKTKFYAYQSIGCKLALFSEEFDEVGNLIEIVWHNAWRDGIVSLSNYLTDQASVIICSLFLNLVETGVYSLTVQIATAVGIVSSVFYTAQQPTLQSAYVSNDKEKLRNTMSLIVTIFLVSFIVLAIMTCIMGLPIMNMIKPDTKIPIWLFCFVVIYQFILRFRNCYTSYFSCTNRIPYVNSFIITSVASVLSSFVLTGLLGLGFLGLIISQILSQLMFNAWYWPLMAHKELDMTFVDLLNCGFLQIKEKIFKRNNL